jgi:hypothetical protein
MKTKNQEGPDYTMLSRRWSGETLITTETALELARSVHRNLYGADDLSANEPLTATEDGDNWIVRGSKKMKELRANEPLDGPMIMKISKYDAQILSYMFGIKPSGGSKQ